MLTDQNFDDLKTEGYTVVLNVLTPAQCDKAIDGYNTWLSKYFEGTWSQSTKGLIRGYNTGHLETTWQLRHQVKGVFEQIWKTDKLLTSFDSIAIGRPPEGGDEPFDDGSTHWLHLDQESTRDGLHAYQGGVYLEEACEDDWTLQVMESSHNVFHKFFAANPQAAKTSHRTHFLRLSKPEVGYFEQEGCKVKRVSVPKGGMVLWDSRVVHANAQPKMNRENPGRWRYVAFISMTPAIWASEKDLGIKKIAYEGCLMTTHWSSEGSRLMKESPDCKHDTKSLANAARTIEGQLLAGVTLYDFTDGKPNGPPKPLIKTLSVLLGEQSVKAESEVQV